jgi:hypothetical protein
MLILICYEPPLFLLYADARICRRFHLTSKKNPEPSLQALGITAKTRSKTELEYKALDDYVKN